MKRISAFVRRLILGTVTACLLAVTAQARFSDMPPDHWCAGPIGEMERLGIINGYADGTFRPSNPVTAAQFVVMVSRCAAPVPNGTDGETDTGVSGTHWASETLAAALRSGWYDWDELPPTGERYDRPINRALAAKILMRALLPEVRGDYLTESRKIQDFSQLDGRYYEAVLAAYAAGVLQGDSRGNFNPAGGLTRAAACAVIARALEKRDAGSVPVTGAGEQTEITAPEPVDAVRGGVSENGWLQVRGAQLCNEAGNPVVLRGLSSHGLQWYGQYASAEAVRNTAAWGANLFRAAMYTAEGGYLSNPDAMREKTTTAVDAAISCGIYAIIDWHILSDGNPMDHADEAEAFFRYMARRYRDSPAVLYEICNEPNGSVTWERDIKPYAERMIRVIREQSPRAVILIGTGTWSQDIHLAAESPIEGENLLYTFHFYAGTHGEDLRRRLRNAVSGGLPVFVTEWGTSRADGSGGVYLEEAGRWLDLMEELGISWANWSLCDKAETSAALQPGTAPDAEWRETDLTASGRFVFSRLRGQGNS